MDPGNPSASRSPRARVGGYELCAKIADGGMATVYVARRVDGPGAGQVVAIKRIREEFARNREFVTMFLDEARLVAGLRHPNVAAYREFGKDAGEVFLAMELLYGQSLWTVWEACRARGVRLRYPMLAWMGARVAEGLHYAHDLRDEAGRPLDIVHRDVNATNIFVTYDGEIKIIDFGLAKAANRVSKTAAGVIKGKVAYMSPEQAVGTEVDRRTDVFALATTLWEIACDRRLFKQQDEVETLRRVHEAVVPDPTTLVQGFPVPLWRILSRALARARDDRHATAAQFASELDAFARAAHGGGGDARSVADAMRDLFGGDAERQRRWVAEASAASERPGEDAPLKERTTLWGSGVMSEDPARALPPQVLPRPPGIPPRAGARVTASTSDGPSRPRVARQIAIAIAAVVIAVFAVALALR